MWNTRHLSRNTTWTISYLQYTEIRRARWKGGNNNTCSIYKVSRTRNEPERKTSRQGLFSERGGIAWDRVVVISAVMRIMTQQSPRIKMLVNILIVDDVINRVDNLKFSVLNMSSSKILKNLCYNGIISLFRLRMILHN